MIFPETNEIGIASTQTPTRTSYTTTFKPNEKIEKIKPFVSFGKKPKKPSSPHPTHKGTTSKSPSKLWSALPPHLPKSTTSSPTPIESTTMPQKLANTVKRVKKPKKKVKPFVFLGPAGSKEPQTEIQKIKPSVSYVKRVKSTKSTSVYVNKVVTTKATKPSQIYFKKVPTTKVPKPSYTSFKKVKSSQVTPLKIFNVDNEMNLKSSQNSSFTRPTKFQPVRYKFTTTSTTHRKTLTTKGTTRKTTTTTTPAPPTTKATTTTTTTTTKRNQGKKLVTEPFFPVSSSNQKKPVTEDKSEKLKVTTEKSSEDDEDEKKSFSLMVSALGVPDIWDMLLFGRYMRVQSQNIHQSGIVSMQPLQ